MKKFFSLFLFMSALFALTLTPPKAAFAEEPVTIKAEGLAIKADDTAEVKKKAIDMALRRVVAISAAEIAKKDIPGANPDVIKEKIEPMARDFILNYRIISEGWINHKEPIPDADMELPENGAQSNSSGMDVFHIWIEASVDTTVLRDAISKATGQEVGPTAAISITLVDITDYAAYRSVIEAIERLNMVRELSYGSFYRGRIVLNARVSGGAELFYNKLSKEIGEGLALTMASADNLLIRGLPRAVLSE